MVFRRRRRKKKKNRFGTWMTRLAVWCFIFLLGVWVTLMALSTVHRNLPDRSPEPDGPGVAAVAREHCVDVWNGNGRRGAAGNMATRLREQGFLVVASENAARFDYPRTVVVDRIGDADGARAVARAIGDTDIVLQREEVDGECDFLVIVGHDWISESD